MGAVAVEPRVELGVGAEGSSVLVMALGVRDHRGEPDWHQTVAPEQRVLELDPCGEMSTEAVAGGMEESRRERAFEQQLV